MTELEFARAYLGDYTVKGAEIVPKLCPYCKGGKHNDKNTFALNMDKHTFKCLRGSCGKQGHFSELLRDFGAGSMDVYTPPVKCVYKKPQAPKILPSTRVHEYIKARGITLETAKAYGVGVNDKGEVVFPYSLSST